MSVAILLVVGIAVVIVLSSTGGPSARSPYALAAERLCVDASREISQTDRRAQPSAVEPNTRARSVVKIVGGLRTGLADLVAAEDEALGAVALEDALLKAETGLIYLRTLETRDGDLARQRIRQTTAAATEVENAALSLDLAQCARLQIVAPSR